VGRYLILYRVQAKLVEIVGVTQGKQGHPFVSVQDAWDSSSGRLKEGAMRAVALTTYCHGSA
jgi:hypothetical protein